MGRKLKKNKPYNNKKSSPKPQKAKTPNQRRFEELNRQTNGITSKERTRSEEEIRMSIWGESSTAKKRKPISNVTPVSEEQLKKKKRKSIDIDTSLPENVYEKKSKRAQKKQKEKAYRQNSKKHKKRRKKNYILYYLLLLIIITVAGITLSVTVFFNISSIEVNGTQMYSDEQIIDYADISEGDNLFRLNLKKAENNILDNCIYLDGVDIKRRLPDVLSIECIEANPQTAIYYKNKYYIVSSGGRIILECDNLEAYPDIFLIYDFDLAGLKTGDFITQNSDYKTFEEVWKTVETVGMADNITVSYINSGVDVKLCYQNRIIISLGNVLELDYKLSSAKKIIDESIGAQESGILDVSNMGSGSDKLSNRATFRAQMINPHPTEEDLTDTTSNTDTGDNTDVSDTATTDGTATDETSPDTANE